MLAFAERTQRMPQAFDGRISEFLPFLNIMNEWYLRDQSRKMTAAFRQKGNSGLPTNNNCIYGYRKDPENKNHWLIDTEAAEVVRRIYQMAAEGMGAYGIARTLTQEGVDNPGYYFHQQVAPGMRKDYVGEEHRHDWSGATVMRILTHPEYKGHTVNFRSGKRSFKDKREFKRPEEWVVFENTHEAIVSEDAWDLVQRSLISKKRTDTLGAANPLTGLVYCADCGARMYNHRTGAKKGEVFATDCYQCATYNKSRSREIATCSSHIISTRAIRSVLTETIRSVSQYALANEADFERQVRQFAQVRQTDSAKALKTKIKKAKKRSDELDVLIKKLYEAYALEKIPEKRFDALLTEYETEQESIRQTLNAEQGSLDAYEADSENLSSFIALAQKYRNAEVLTTPMIYEFVDKIMVHKPEKVNGERHVQVDIYLRFIGNFQVPKPEPTAAELERQEKDRIRRAKNRERDARRRTKIAAQKQEGAANEGCKMDCAV